MVPRNININIIPHLQLLVFYTIPATTSEFNTYVSKTASIIQKGQKTKNKNNIINSWKQLLGNCSYTGTGIRTVGAR